MQFSNYCFHLVTLILWIFRPIIEISNKHVANWEARKLRRKTVSTHEDTYTSEHAQPNTPSQSMKSLASSSLFYGNNPTVTNMNFDNLTMVDFQVSSNSVFISKKTSHNKNRRHSIYQFFDMSTPCLCNTLQTKPWWKKNEFHSIWMHFYLPLPFSRRIIDSMHLHIIHLLRNKAMMHMIVLQLWKRKFRTKKCCLDQ